MHQKFLALIDNQTATGDVLSKIVGGNRKRSVIPSDSK